MTPWKKQDLTVSSFEGDLVNTDPTIKAYLIKSLITTGGCAGFFMMNMIRDQSACLNEAIKYNNV